MEFGSFSLDVLCVSLQQILEEFSDIIQVTTIFYLSSVFVFIYFYWTVFFFFCLDNYFIMKLTSVFYLFLVLVFILLDLALFR